MDIEDFDYDLPENLISQNLLPNRDESKLLVVRPDGSFVDSIFYNLHKFIDSDSLVVFNDSKVIKAFIVLHKGQSEIGVNLNKPLTETIWTGFAKRNNRFIVEERRYALY